MDHGDTLSSLFSRAWLMYALLVLFLTPSHTVPIQPFPKQQLLDSAELEDFADDNFKFYENGRKFSRRVENTVEKGEIARNEQFLLFPLCFQKTCTVYT